MSGVRRVWRWAPPYCAGAGAVLPLVAVAAASKGWVIVALGLALAAAACCVALNRALGEWRRATLIERSARVQPVRRQGRSAMGWGPPVWRRGL